MILNVTLSCSVTKTFLSYSTNPNTLANFEQQRTIFTLTLSKNSTELDMLLPQSRVKVKCLKLIFKKVVTFNSCNSLGFKIEAKGIKIPIVQCS